MTWHSSRETDKRIPRDFCLHANVSRRKNKLDQGMAQALLKIKEKQHDAVVKQRKVPHIVHIGIAFAGKHAWVGMA